MLVHRDHGGFKQLLRAKSHHANTWIPELISQVRSSKGVLFSMRGYLAHEIVPLMTLGSQSHKDFVRILRPYRKYPEPDAQQNKIRFDAAEFDAGRDVVIIDLALFRQVYERIFSESAGFQLFKIDHGLDIPVGIGFSLRTVDRFRKPEAHRNTWKKKWGEFQEKAYESLRDSEQDLCDVGIQLIPIKERCEKWESLISPM